MSQPTIYCGQCGAPNAAGTRFCGRCGRPLGGPAPVPVAMARQPAFAGAYAYPYAYAPASPAQVAAAPPHRTGGALLWILAAGGVLFFMVCLAIIAVILAGSGPGTRTCPPTCNPPPRKLPPPLAADHTYTSSKYGYSLTYSDTLVTQQGAQVAAQDDTGIGFTIKGYPFAVQAEPPNGRSAQQLAEAIQQAKLPDATLVYTLPAAEVGYAPGYGAVYDATVQSSSGQALHVRMVVEVAIKKGLAVEFWEIGPFQQSTPKDSFPNPSDTPIVFLTEGLPNSVVFPGDQPR